MIICDRTQPLQYRCGHWQGFATSQVLAQLEPQYGDPAAMARGSAIHAACACLALDIDPEIPPIFLHDPVTFDGYLCSYRKWFDARVASVLSVEEPARNEKLHYGTRIDLYARLFTSNGEAVTIVELKTGQPNRLNKVQIHAQKKLDGIEATAKMLLLYLRPDGYTEVPVPWNPLDWAVFESQVIALWNVHQWRQR